MMNLKNVPWCEKYRVHGLEDIKGQELAVDKIKMFLKSFPKKKAIVLHGSPGVGKTSLAYAVASENDCEILELNASDFRNKAKISGIVEPASRQASLFGKGKIILIDEVLTPDSSRFWPADIYEAGRDQESFDKQFVRNYLESINFDKSGPGVELPDDIVTKTSDKYIEAYEQLAGKKFEFKYI